MTGGRIERRQRVARPVEEAFEFYADPANLARITPPWLSFELVAWQAPGESATRAARGSRIPMAEGLRLHYRIRPLLVPQRWVSVISRWDPPRAFADEQVRGPYRRWHHTHEFHAVDGGTELYDLVEYEIGWGPAGALANAVLVRRQVKAIFDYRAHAVARIFS